MQAVVPPTIRMTKTETVCDWSDFDRNDSEGALQQRWKWLLWVDYGLSSQAAIGQKQTITIGFSLRLSDEKRRLSAP